MSLPTNAPRCRGRRVANTECTGCARRIAAQALKHQAWPVWVVWMVPPIVRPCPQRIEAATEVEHAEVV